MANPDDPATAMSSTQLAQPLAQRMKSQYTGWNVKLIDPENVDHYLARDGYKALERCLAAIRHPLRHIPRSGAPPRRDAPGRARPQPGWPA